MGPCRDFSKDCSDFISLKFDFFNCAVVYCEQKPFWHKFSKFFSYKSFDLALLSLLSNENTNQGNVVPNTLATPSCDKDRRSGVDRMLSNHTKAGERVTWRTCQLTDRRTDGQHSPKHGCEISTWVAQQLTVAGGVKTAEGPPRTTSCDASMTMSQ